MTYQQSTNNMSPENQTGFADNNQTQPVLETAKLYRYGVVLPLAAMATIGLMTSMAALIATEFTPQDKVESASFEINPKVEDIPDPIRTLRLDPLRDVEVPPPPPTIATDDAAKVEIPVIKVAGNVTPFTMEKLDIGKDFDIVPIDQNPTPQVRIPPVFPNRFSQGNVSGYCKVRFDISPQGQPMNVETTLCTSSQLKSATVKSVRGWKYAPEIRDGRPVSRSGLETIIRFDLRDERGEILPLPAGF